MGEEMLDLLQHDRRQVATLTHVRIIRKCGIDGHADQLFIAAMFVFKVQHANRARAHNAACDKGRTGNNQRIQRVAIRRQSVRHEAVIRRIAHRRVQDAVHEQRA